MERLYYYRLTAKKYLDVIIRKGALYYTEAARLGKAHRKEIIATVAYVPYAGWLYPLYFFENDAEIQKHAKRALLYAVCFTAAALTVFLVLFFIPRSWRAVEFLFTIVLYSNYSIYYAIAAVHVWCIWNKKDFSIKKFEIYLEKLEQYV